MNPDTPVPADALVIEQTRAWMRHAVIGLNLCPFARGVDAKGQVRFVVSPATTPEALLQQLSDELRRLNDVDAEQVETTLLIHPHVMGDFEDFNDFLEIADELVFDLGLEGELQVASFHPDYQFADTEPDDVTNATNRSPWPTLHLLREASIDRAVAAFPEPEAIFETNMATLTGLGKKGWAELQAKVQADAESAVAMGGGASGPVGRSDA